MGDLWVHSLGNGLFVAWRGKPPPMLVAYGMKFRDGTIIVGSDSSPVAMGTFVGKGLVLIGTMDVPELSRATQRQVGDVTVRWLGKDEPEAAGDGTLEFPDGSGIAPNGERYGLTFMGDGFLAIERSEVSEGREPHEIAVRMPAWADNLFKPRTRTGTLV